MKIVILVRILSTGGAQKIAIAEARELSRLGHEVELVFLRGSAIKEFESTLRGVNYKILSQESTSVFSPLYGYVTKKFAPDRGKESKVDFDLLRSFPSYLNGRDVDFLICHDQFAGLAGYFAHRKLGVKYSVFIHERLSMPSIPILGKLWTRYEFKILKNASAVFAITKKVNETIVREYKIQAITDFPGMNIINKTSYENKENSIISVAMWDLGRRPELYLDIIESLDGFNYYFVGNWRTVSAREKFIACLSARRLNDRVVIREHINESELSCLFQRSKFSVRFGFGEFGLGTSTVESIQQCVPLIVNQDLGTAGIIQDYSCGLVVSRADPMEINQFIKNNNNRRSYSRLQENISKLAESYTWYNHVVKLLQS